MRLEGRTGLGVGVGLAFLSVEGPVVVSDRCPGRAGCKVLTGCLLANGFSLTEAFALAMSEAGWHLLFVAWRIPGGRCLLQWCSVQAAGSAFGWECSQPAQHWGLSPKSLTPYICGAQC